MPTTQDHLAEIEQLLIKGFAAKTEKQLKTLLNQMGNQELLTWKNDIQKIINMYQDRRRKSLQQEFDRLVSPDKFTIKKANEKERKILKDSEKNQLQTFENGLQFRLKNLSEQHIFQWASFYRSTIIPILDGILEDTPNNEKIAIINNCLSEHAREIFQKGYEYTSQQKSYNHTEVLQKSLTGLSRFLDIPIEFYSERSSKYQQGREAIRLRQLISAVIYGIVNGFGSSIFGKDEGWQILPRFPRSWAHYLAFYTSKDIENLSNKIEPGEFLSGVKTSVIPFIKALDGILEKYIGCLAPIPILSQMLWDQRRLEIGLRHPNESGGLQIIESYIYLNESFVTTNEVKASINRGITVIVSPLKPDVIDYILSQETMKNVVIPVKADSDKRSVESIYSKLDDLMSRLQSKRESGAPLIYNVAADFPLKNPFREKYYHVTRSSVRDLLRTFERSNGVRLWCSVRRSGKTTACFDLGDTSGHSIVVPQTCDSTDPDSEKHIFYDSILKGLNEGKQLSNDYFASLVVQCAPSRIGNEKRFVFVIDEYETLFGRLKGSLKKEPELRYTIIQPLLNQMVAFSRDNLLVFMGQHPNAHYIIMDQNQLSAYIEQDSFPLFQHTFGTTKGEFSEFIGKVITNIISTDSAFLDSLYEETAGHPYLTVNVLVELVEWLISIKRPAQGLRLRQDDFMEFAKQKLSKQKISLSTQYDFFRAAISEAISLDGIQNNPWLHAIYKSIQEIALNSPSSLSVTLNDFNSLLERKVNIEQLGLSPDEIIRTGVKSNFLTQNNNNVSIKIPILGRIATTARTKQ